MAGRKQAGRQVGKLDKDLTAARAEVMVLADRFEGLATNIEGSRNYYTGNADLTAYLAAAEKACRDLAGRAKAVRMPLDAAASAAGRGFEEQLQLPGGDGEGEAGDAD